LATAPTSRPSGLPDWDADSPTLRSNLDVVETRLRADAGNRVLPSFEDAREWHALMMKGLDPGMDPIVVGHFRGEPGLESMGVFIGGGPKTVRGIPVGAIWGTAPWLVGAELQAFEDTLQDKLRPLDAKYPDAASLDDAGRGQVIRVSAWAHSEWVRIHPFANGNGRTARMWANLVLLRYGMPPVMRLRPRPFGPDKTEYAEAGEAGMKGDAAPVERYIRRKYDETLKVAAAVTPAATKQSTAQKAASKTAAKKTR
jgi:hypothetical protein